MQKPKIERDRETDRETEREREREREREDRAMLACVYNISICL